MQDGKKGHAKLHTLFIVYEMTVQGLHGAVAVYEMTMQGLHGLFTVCEMITQGLHGLFIVYEMIMQGLHGLFTVCEMISKPSPRWARVQAGANDYSLPGVSPRAIIHRAYSPDG